MSFVLNVDDHIRGAVLARLAEIGIVTQEVAPSDLPGNPGRLRAYAVAGVKHGHAHRQAAAAKADLTSRQFEVLQGIAAGHKSGELGVQLGLTEATIRTHTWRLYKKLGVNDRAHAVLIGFRRGILGGES